MEHFVMHHQKNQYKWKILIKKKSVIEVSDDSSTIKARDELIILPDDDDVLELLKEFTPELNSIFFNQSTSFTTWRNVR